MADLSQIMIKRSNNEPTTSNSLKGPQKTGIKFAYYVICSLKRLYIKFSNTYKGHHYLE